MSDTKDCKCGKKMILKKTGIALDSMPPIYPRVWWCGGCGHQEDGPSERGRTQKERDMERWEEANT